MSYSPEFLAGLFYGRGKCYISSTRRGNGIKRYAASLSVELSEPDDNLRPIFGNPVERRYYGSPTYRYVLQDRDKIVEFIDLIGEHIPYYASHQLRAFRNFCVAPADEREKAANIYHVTRG